MVGRRTEWLKRSRANWNQLNGYVQRVIVDQVVELLEARELLMQYQALLEMEGGISSAILNAWLERNGGKG